MCDAKHEIGYCASHDERPIDLRQISVHLAFSSSGQKDDSYRTHFTVSTMCILSFSPQKNEQWCAALYGKI